MKRMHFWAAGLAAAAAVLPAAARAQMLPSHEAAGLEIPRAAPRAPLLQQGHLGAWGADIGLDLLMAPSPRDSRFDQALGLGLNATLPLQAVTALRFGIGFETLEAKRGRRDADIVPLGVSFLIGPAFGGPLRVGAEVGLRYNFTDYSEGGRTYDDGVGGIFGLAVIADLTDTFAVELGAGYRFDISKSRSDFGDLSLEMTALRIGFRAAF